MWEGMYAGETEGRYYFETSEAIRVGRRGNAVGFCLTYFDTSGVGLVLPSPSVVRSYYLGGRWV